MILGLKVGPGLELLQEEQMLVCERNPAVSFSPAKPEFCACVALSGFETLVEAAALLNVFPRIVVEPSTTTSINAAASFKILATIDTSFGPF